MVNPSPRTVPEHLRRINAALALRDIPDHAAALEHLLKAAELAPTDSSVYILLGLTYQDMEQVDSAEQALRRALELTPDSTDAQQALGRLLMHRSRYAEAEQLLRPVVRCDEPDPAIVRAYATVLVELHRAQEALDLLQTTFDRLPHDADMAAQLGRLLLAERKLEAAIAVLQQALALTDSVDLRCDLAEALSFSDHTHEALAVLEQASRLDPASDRVWRNMAYCLLHLAQPPEALAAAERAVQLGETDPRNWQAKANALSRQDKSGDAVAALTRAVELARQQPDHRYALPSSLLFRSVELLRWRGLEAGLAQLDQDLAVYPDVLILYQLKAQLHLAVGQYDLAEVTVERALQRGADRATFRKERFYAYHGLGQPDRALSCLQPLPETEAELTQVFDDMQHAGRELYLAGQPESARLVFEQMLTLKADHSDALNNLGFLLIGFAEYDRAATLLRSAQTRGYDPRCIPFINLGTVYLRQGVYDQAIASFQAAEPLIRPDHDEALLHTACWRNGEISSTPTERFPKRLIRSQLAIHANLAAAYYLAGQSDQALASAHQAITVAPDDNIGYRVLGCLHLALGDIPRARAAWQQALEKRKSKAEAELIRGWLDALPPSES